MSFPLYEKRGEGQIQEETICFLSPSLELFFQLLYIYNVLKHLDKAYPLPRGGKMESFCLEKGDT